MQVPEEDVVGLDAIWKNHVTKLNKNQRVQWPADWGFLVDEYKILTDTLKHRKGKGDKARDESDIDFSTKETMAREEQIKERMASDYGLQRRYPETTTQEIGFWSTHKKYQLEKFGRYCRPRPDIYKSLGWPRGGEN